MASPASWLAAAAYAIQEAGLMYLAGGEGGVRSDADRILCYILCYILSYIYATYYAVRG